MVATQQQQQPQLQRRELRPTDVLRIADVAAHLSIGESTWWRWVQKGIAPAGKRIAGTNMRYWTGAEILQFTAPDKVAP